MHPVHSCFLTIMHYTNPWTHSLQAFPTLLSSIPFSSICHSPAFFPFSPVPSSRTPEASFPGPCHKPTMFKYRDKEQLLTIYNLFPFAIFPPISPSLTLCFLFSLFPSPSSPLSSPLSSPFPVPLLLSVEDVGWMGVACCGFCTSSAYMF